MIPRAVVTGASRGIGLQCATVLAEIGYSVALIGRDLETLESVTKDLNSSTSSNHTAHCCDVSQPKEVIDCVRDITNNGENRINVLVNAAGVVHNGLLVRTSDDAIKTIIGTNLLGPIHMCREVSKVMIKHQNTKVNENNEIEMNSTILNVGSVVGSSGNSGQCLYSTSKAGLAGLTLSLAKELGQRNIRVNLIEPGFINTDMTNNMPIKKKNEIENKIILNKFGETNDVANLVKYLVGTGGSYITGQTIRIDGGLIL
jgi:3-oxoacyl-[acyl-carrier protein] reductase